MPRVKILKDRLPPGALRLPIVFFALALLFLLFIGGVETVLSIRKGENEILSAGERWFPPGTRSSVIALYLPPDEKVTAEQAVYWENEIEKTLLDASIEERPAFCRGFSVDAVVSCERR